MVDEMHPDMRVAIRVPIDLQDGTKLVLVVMVDGALLYRRAKIKVAMSQSEVAYTNSKRRCPECSHSDPLPHTVERRLLVFTGIFLPGEASIIFTRVYD